MHQLTDRKINLILYIIFFLTLSTISSKNPNNIKIFSGKITEIDVLGLADVNNKEIKEELSKVISQNIFLINKNSIELVMSKYNLIESYEVIKIYPTKIKIKIEPTEFIAQIRKDGLFFIGSNAKLIKAEDIDYELPFLFGEFNSKKFLEFKKIINESKFRLKEIKSIFFFPIK